ncbi:MAG TPA: site-2 protease family protein [Polyangiaceae bacterium]|nr:site-2 protease family protein [Polyangiaceae bacterium]
MNPEHDLRPSVPPSVRAGALPPFRTNLILFLLTIVSVFHAGVAFAGGADERSFLRQLLDPEYLMRGASFAVPLLGILLTHEFGHFFAARWHRVPASFPYFIPFPGLLFGTMGAVMAMPAPIRSRRALLDIGAAGPIAGLVVAIPVLCFGLARSEVLPPPEAGVLVIQEGQSVLYLLLKRLVVGPIPEGHDVALHPTAVAGWAGLFLTMINLLPWGQLDGGHIVYALIGQRHHAIARWVRRALLLLFAYNVFVFVVPVLTNRSELPLPLAISNSAFWLVWFLVLGVIGFVSGGAKHPPYEPGELDGRRRALGWACVVLFVLLFMPTPLSYR